MQLASYLERGPLMWLMPLHLNQKSDYDDDDTPIKHIKHSTVERNSRSLCDLRIISLAIKLIGFPYRRSEYLHISTSFKFHVINFICLYPGTVLLSLYLTNLTHRLQCATVYSVYTVLTAKSSSGVMFL